MAAVTQFWSDWSNFLGEILDIIDPKHTKRTKRSEILLLFETPYSAPYIYETLGHSEFRASVACFNYYKSIHMTSWNSPSNHNYCLPEDCDLSLGCLSNLLGSFLTSFKAPAEEQDMGASPGL